MDPLQCGAVAGGGVVQSVAKSDFSDAADAAQARLAAPMKSMGFRRQGRTYNRTASDGVIQVVNLQMWPAPLGAPDPVKERILGPDRYGMLAVNLGIYVPEIARFHGYSEGRSVHDTKCAIRVRLETLLGFDHFAWRLDRPPADIAEELLTPIRRDGIEFLDKWRSRNAIVDHWVEYNDAELRLTNVARLDVAIMRAAEGRLDLATDLLNEHIARVDGSRHNGRHHVAYVRELASKLGIQELRSWP